MRTGIWRYTGSSKQHPNLEPFSIRAGFPWISPELCGSVWCCGEHLLLLARPRASPAVSHAPSCPPCHVPPPAVSFFNFWPSLHTSFGRVVQLAFSLVACLKIFRLKLLLTSNGPGWDSHRLSPCTFVEFLGRFHRNNTYSIMCCHSFQMRC